MLLLLGALILFASAVQARWRHTHGSSFVPDAVLRVTAENISQSCLPAKLTVLINGTSPGPELRLTAGKTQWIRVHNDIVDQELTMHWHGLSMAVSPFSDGTPQASQWAIPPLHFFDYEIHTTDELAGTYFYHSHVGFQAVSAAGPLIVDEECPPPYEYDEERIIFIGDVFKKTNEQIETGLTSNPFVWSGESAMVLVNGKGGGTANGTACNASLSVIDVEPDKTYRLRFIGSTALTFASLAIEGHDQLTIIEADGSYTKPFNTKFLQIGSGQRFSALLHTKSTLNASSYYIQLESRDRPTVTRGYAVLRYRHKHRNHHQHHQQKRHYYPPTPSASPPLTLPATVHGFLDYQLAPLHPNNCPSAAAVTRRVIMTVHQHAAGYITWQSNGLPWTSEVVPVPYLVALYQDNATEYPSLARALTNNGLDRITDAFPAEIGEVVEIVIQNTGSDAKGVDAHPFHAHGRHYCDIGSGSGLYDAEANEARLKNTTPVLRDTTMLYRYNTTAPANFPAGWRAWRLRVIQPGVWMVHCHILQHMVMGMQSVWVMGNRTELLRDVPAPEVGGYLSYGGDVYGNKTHWPRPVHFFDNWAAHQ